MQVYGPRQPSTGAYAIVTGVFSQQQIDGEQLTIEGEPCCRYCFLVHASAAVDMPAHQRAPRKPASGSCGSDACLLFKIIGMWSCCKCKSPSIPPGQGCTGWLWLYLHDRNTDTGQMSLLPCLSQDSNRYDWLCCRRWLSLPGLHPCIRHCGWTDCGHAEQSARCLHQFGYWQDLDGQGELGAALQRTLTSQCPGCASCAPLVPLYIK